METIFHDGHILLTCKWWQPIGLIPAGFDKVCLDQGRWYGSNQGDTRKEVFLCAAGIRIYWYDLHCSFQCLFSCFSAVLHIEGPTIGYNTLFTCLRNDYPTVFNIRCLKIKEQDVWLMSISINIRLTLQDVLKHLFNSHYLYLQEIISIRRTFLQTFGRSLRHIAIHWGIWFGALHCCEARCHKVEICLSKPSLLSICMPNNFTHSTDWITWLSMVSSIDRQSWPLAIKLSSQFILVDSMNSWMFSEIWHFLFHFISLVCFVLLLSPLVYQSPRTGIYIYI